MSEPIRIDITGKNAEIWNRIIDQLSETVEKTVQSMMPKYEPETRKKAAQAAKDIAELTGSWLQAKLESPTLDNEQKIADIAAKFEDIKLSEARRRGIEADTDIKLVQLDRARLRFWQEQLAAALRTLCLFEGHFIRDADGNVTLLITNENLVQLTAALKGKDDDSENWKE